MPEYTEQMGQDIKAALAKLPEYGRLMRFCGEVLQDGGPPVAHCGDTSEGGHLWAEVFTNAPQWLAAQAAEIERVEEDLRWSEHVRRGAILTVAEQMQRAERAEQSLHGCEIDRMGWLERAQKAEQQLAAVTAERDQLFAQLDANWVQHQRVVASRKQAEAAVAERDALAGQVVELRAALEKYGRHIHGTNTMLCSKRIAGAAPCTCGLDAALSSTGRAGAAAIRVADYMLGVRWPAYWGAGLAPLVDAYRQAKGEQHG